jgi:integrase
MAGNITRRGKRSWRIKYELPRDPATGERRVGYATIRGKRADAEKALREILYKQDHGVAIDPSNLRVAEYLETWLADVAPRTVAPKALERYRGLVRHQIKPHLGAVLLQKLRPAHIDKWLLQLGRTDLSIRSIRHAHGVLRTALAHAASVEVVERNVCKIIAPPKLERTEIETLTAEQVVETFRKLDGHPFYAVAAFAIGTGARRGEIAALRWSDLDLDRAMVRIERSVEQTKEGLRIKPTKTAAGRRTISLPDATVKALRDHRRQTLELRMALGMGAPTADTPVFADLDGEALSPHLLTNRWRRAVKNRKLPKVSFHAWRHSHASALIAAGLDVVAVSRRLGHASPALTLNVYSHMFQNSDDRAAAAIDAALG